MEEWASIIAEILKVLNYLHITTKIYKMNKFSDCRQNIDDYLKKLYQNWQNPDTRDTIFGDIPINNPSGIGGFTSNCPPIPWMGNISTAEYALVSLEPLLDNRNFGPQIAATKTYNDWRNFYFENYFDNFFGPGGLNPTLTPYWRGITNFFKHLLQAQNEENPINILNRIVEIPFCQYHARNHPTYIPNEILLNDFAKRIKFFLTCNRRNNQKIIVFGSKPFKKFDQEIYGEYLEKDLLANEPIYVRHANPRILRVKEIFGGRFFMRNAPFSNGWQLTAAGLERLAEIIREY